MCVFPEIVREISLRTVNATELFYNKLLEKLRHRKGRRWRHRSQILKDNEEALDDLGEELQSELILNEDFLDKNEGSTNHNEIELSDSDDGGEDGLY